MSQQQEAAGKDAKYVFLPFSVPCDRTKGSHGGHEKTVRMCKCMPARPQKFAFVAFVAFVAFFAFEVQYCTVCFYKIHPKKQVLLNLAFFKDVISCYLSMKTEKASYPMLHECLNYSGRACTAGCGLYL